MALATDVEICGTDGVWRKLSVEHALSSSNRTRIRCVECRGRVRLHRASDDGTQAAHAEHIKRWDGCPRSDAYDEGGLRMNPNLFEG